MPSTSTLLWISLPAILVALSYQVAWPTFILTLIFKNQILHDLVATTHCYSSVNTLSATIPRAECFSVVNAKFSKVSLNDASDVARSRAGHVIPGLWDGHGHLVQFGESLDSVSIFGSESMDEVQRRLVEYRARHLSAGTSELWLRGVGWDQANFGGRWPTSVCLRPLCIDLSMLTYNSGVTVTDVPIAGSGNRRSLPRSLCYARSC